MPAGALDPASLVERHRSGEVSLAGIGRALLDLDPDEREAVLSGGLNACERGVVEATAARLQGSR